MMQGKLFLQIKLFTAFFRVGLLGFGGGPSSIPLVYKEVVDTYKWMDEEQFSEILALGNTLPGPIITKMAGYIGYRAGGIAGMFTALAASIIPTIILMLLLLSTFNQLKDHPRVQGMTNAVVPIVGVMMAVLTWKFLVNSKKVLGWKISLLFLAASFILIEVLHIHPGIVVGLLLIMALMTPVKNKDKYNKGNGNNQ